MKKKKVELELQAGSDLGGMSPSIDDTVKQQIMDALRVRVQGENIIGLCGSNKQVEDFVKKSIRKVKRDQLFQNIVTATVSKKLDITKIQTQIGDAIGLNFDNKMDLAESTFWMCFGSLCSLAPAFLMDEEGSPLSLWGDDFISCAAQGDDHIPLDMVKEEIMDALRIRDQGINIIGLCGGVADSFSRTI
ncbi:hypothetical protein P8452_39278 [Trifolium repens]|nr:hypothetical protein P8452_39278 [Trifolium repens]